MASARLRGQCSGAGFHHFVNAMPGGCRQRGVRLGRAAKLANRLTLELVPEQANTWHEFEVLGTNARSAVPALIEIAQRNVSEDSLSSAIDALEFIGPALKGAGGR